jgi:hypothetical protein
MTIDFNDADPQRSGDLIPDGTYCSLKATVRPGGNDLPGHEYDHGLFRLSSKPDSDAVMVDIELTVLPPSPHAGRKLWQLFTVHGGSVDEDGTSKGWMVSKSTMRAVIDSALGLEPTDMSEEAKAKRTMRGFRDLDGIEFFARIGIERGGPTGDGGTFLDKNRIAHIVVPGELQYPALKAGKEVPPAPSSRPAAPAAAAAQPKPTWQQEAAEPKTATAPQGPAWLRGEKQ